MSPPPDVAPTTSSRTCATPSRKAIHPDRINLNELVAKVARVVRPDAVAHSCEVETSLAKDLPLIEGDPVQIQQVLVNLVVMHLMPCERRHRASARWKLAPVAMATTTSA